MTCWSEERFPLLSHTATDLDENPCARYMACSSRDALLTGAAKIFLQQYHAAPCLDENCVQATYEFQNLQHHTAAVTTTTTLSKNVFHFGLAEPLLLPFYYFTQLKLLLTRLQAICFVLLSFQFCYTRRIVSHTRLWLCRVLQEPLDNILILDTGRPRCSCLVRNIALVCFSALSFAVSVASKISELIGA
jgi:hypothetical protein